MNKTLATAIIETLRSRFGVYSGNWTEASIRTAGQQDASTQQITKLMLDKHPPSGSLGSTQSSLSRIEERRLREQRTRGRATGSIYGHWLMPTGELTGQLHDHAASAREVLQQAIPGYQSKADPIADLMNLSGAIRVRHAPPTATIVDMVHQPTALQHQKLSEMAKKVEGNAGYFQWNVINGNDTGTLGDGTSYDEFSNFRWPKTTSGS